MKTVGIIAEYNPFHKGHAYHIARAKALSHADYCIIVMSGNFLQRGEAACMDKYVRARCALSQGAYLFLELPVPFATSNAPSFARNGVFLLRQTGVLTHLSFGCECDELEKLQFLADFFNQEPKVYQAILKENLKKGMDYPTARKESFLTYFSDRKTTTDAWTEPSGQSRAAYCRPSGSLSELAELLDTPNNILALAYLRAIKELAPDVTPIPIKRKGSGYHKTELESGYASAAAIRRELLANGLSKQLLSHLPKSTSVLLSDLLGKQEYVSTDDFSSLLYYKLLSLPADAYAEYAEVSGMLGQRIGKHLPEFTCFSEFARLLMRKNETHTTISRGLLHILLDIKKNQFQAPKYLRILGLKKEAGPLLHEIKEKSRLPIISKPADGPKNLPVTALPLFEKDLFAENLYHGIFRPQTGKLYHPYWKSPVIL